jgi:hypothetical protein
MHYKLNVHYRKPWQPCNTQKHTPAIPYGRKLLPIAELMPLDTKHTCSCSRIEQGQRPVQRQAEWSASCVCFLLTQPPNSATVDAPDVGTFMHSYKGAEWASLQPEMAGRNAAAMTLWGFVRSFETTRCSRDTVDRLPVIKEACDKISGLQPFNVCAKRSQYRPFIMVVTFRVACWAVSPLPSV